MAENKFQPTSASVETFIESLPTTTKIADAKKMLTIFTEASQTPPVMWTHGIIGFGQSNYQTKSGYTGVVPLIAFAPRKTKLVLYLNLDTPKQTELLANLGKHQLSKACLYINKLADVDLAVLTKLVAESLE